MSNNPTFAKAYEELQALTAEFEKGDLDLEKAIPKFKRAAELAKLLKQKLAVLENQIEEIDINAEDPTDSVPNTPQTDGSSDIEF
jgi:exodeoxyribonuclease VII small subunit